MHKHTANILPIFIAALCIAACSSPMDLDTPRDDYFEDSRLAVRAVLLEVQVPGFGDVTYDAQRSTATIDTSGARPFALRMDLLFTAPAGPVRGESLYIDSLRIKTDSLPLVPGMIFTLRHDAAAGVQAFTVTAFGPPFSGSERVHPNGSPDNYWQVDGTHRPALKELELGITMAIKGFSLPLSRGWGADARLVLRY